MARAMEKVECRFCLRKNEALENAKVLPCTHVHCLECLAAHYDVNNILQCLLEECRLVLNYRTVS